MSSVMSKSFLDVGCRYSSLSGHSSSLIAHCSSLGSICQEHWGSLDLHRELTTAAPGAPVPMNAIWRTIRGYILWQYERGTLHYDIMVR